MRKRGPAGFTLLELLLVILLLALAAGWVAPALMDRISRAREQQEVGEVLAALERFCLRCQRWNRPGGSVSTRRGGLWVVWRGNQMRSMPGSRDPCSRRRCRLMPWD